MLQRLDITDAEYFKLPHASNSGLKEAHKLFSASESGERDLTGAYEFGSAIDALLTNPGELNTLNLTNEQRQDVLLMRKALSKDPTYNALCAKADKQVVFTHDAFPIEIDGLQTTIRAKCKYDFWQPRMNFGCDLKSTVAKDQPAFSAAAIFMKYPMQGAWYMDITNSDRFVIIGISKINYKVFTFSIRRGDEHYIKGRAQYMYHSKSWWKLYGVTQGGIGMATE
jgi:hypothetical protein